MTWRVIFHPSVLTEDLPRLDRGAQKVILKTIRKKLAAAPDQFGEALRGELAGLRKLRVGAYRVVYSIRKQLVHVHVLKVGIRRDFQVYDELVRRLPNILDDL